MVPEALLPRQLHAKLDPALTVECCLGLKSEEVLGTMHSVGNAGRAGLKIFLDQGSTGVPTVSDHRGKAPR